MILPWTVTSLRRPSTGVWPTLQAQLLVSLACLTILACRNEYYIRNIGGDDFPFLTLTLLRPTVCRIQLFVLVMVACAPLAAAENDQFPGQKKDGFLLPNGWMITPAGEQVLLKDLPLNILPLSDGRHVLVATSGYNAHELTLIDLESKVIKQTETVRQSWFGLALSPNQDKLWWSGGGGAACTCSVSRMASSPGPTMAIQPRTPAARSEREQVSQRPGARRQTQGALFARHRRRTLDRHRPDGQAAGQDAGTSAAGRTTWRSPATARGSTSPTGPAAPCWRRPGRPPRRRQDRRRRASQPDRPAPEGRPAVRRLRLEQQRRR